MPCYYTGSAEGDVNLAATEARESLTKVTAMLCDTLDEVEREGILHFCSPETQAWWAEHQRIDAIRIEKEESEETQRKLREEGLAKLSPEERTALGQG